MATRPDNIVFFYGEGYGFVRIVKRSLSFRRHQGHWHNPLTGKIEISDFNYWRGQLVDRWQGERQETGEKWGPFYRGQHIWLRDEIFKKVPMIYPFLMKIPNESTHIKGSFDSGTVWINGIRLLPNDSQKVHNHSPDGFKWGYGGSGPAQLALAILLLYLPPDIAQLHYQDFKFGYIAGLPQRDISVNVNLRWVMATILNEGPFQAVKKTTRAI